MRTKSTGGFTLIELLIVIAIIGILAAVLIPNLMNARTTASKRAAQAYSSNVYTAAVAALAENVLWQADEIGPDDCDVTTTTFITGPDGDSAYSFNPTPSGVDSCEIAESGGDVEVTVEWSQGGQSATFINGVEQAAGGGTPNP